MYNILVVDDEPPIVNAIRRVLGRIPASWLAQPCAITSFNDPAEALQSLGGDTAFDVVIADLRMPGMGGLEFLRHAQQLQPDAMRIIISGHGDFSVVLAALNDTQVFRFVPKPWDENELQLAVVQALLTGDLQRENQKLADRVRAGAGSGAEGAASLRKLEAECPGITHVVRDEAGAICIDDDV